MHMEMVMWYVQPYLFIYMHRILKLVLKDMPIVFIVFMFLALGIMNVLGAAVIVWHNVVAWACP